MERPLEGQSSSPFLWAWPPRSLTLHDPESGGTPATPSTLPQGAHPHRGVTTRPRHHSWRPGPPQLHLAGSPPSLPSKPLGTSCCSLAPHPGPGGATSLPGPPSPSMPGMGVSTAGWGGARPPPVLCCAADCAHSLPPACVPVWSCRSLMECLPSRQRLLPGTLTERGE